MRDRPGRPKLMIGTGFIVMSPESKLLIVRQEYQGKVDWGFNGGALEAGESIQDCAIREAYEELGLHVRLERLISVSEIWHEGSMQGIGFAFLATPEPWPQEVQLGTEDLTQFMNYRWLTRAEFDALQSDPDYDFWGLPWPAGISEPFFRRIDS